LSEGKGACGRLFLWPCVRVIEIVFSCLDLADCRPSVPGSGIGLQGNSRFDSPAGSRPTFLSRQESRQRRRPGCGERLLAICRVRRARPNSRPAAAQTADGLHRRPRQIARRRTTGGNGQTVGWRVFPMLPILLGSVFAVKRQRSWRFTRHPKRSEARRGVFTLPYAAPRGLAERAEKRAPCLSIAVRRCELGPGRSFSQPARGL